MGEEVAVALRQCHQWVEAVDLQQAGAAPHRVELDALRGGEPDVGDARRWAADGSTANALDPGFILTCLQQQLDDDTLRAFGVMDEAGTCQVGLLVFKEGLLLTNKGRRRQWQVPTGLTDSPS
ncbi:hypothetical protein ACIQI7_04645 [Kitasatospora sp. NPDC092039]|uniref:hypothetical protein n=1 Tax=Kitasatospora sp. NPDC092039 TaxID=3364086 RepID=UPI0037F2090C